MSVTQVLGLTYGYTGHRSHVFHELLRVMPLAATSCVRFPIWVRHNAFAQHTHTQRGVGNFNLTGKKMDEIFHCEKYVTAEAQNAQSECRCVRKRALTATTYSTKWYMFPVVHSSVCLLPTNKSESVQFAVECSSRMARSRSSGWFHYFVSVNVCECVCVHSGYVPPSRPYSILAQHSSW